MPILNWIGKEKVINHHNEVPYRVLEKKYSYGDDSENMIIHGDNLEALKSLLPLYEGRVKCIYIDPPYNTGNEGWVYNDNVKDPQIVKWLGEVVGKEGDDLSRHDKWLCMMYPRLRLLHKLLSEDGAIFISIDDNELYSLKMICDEIFGPSNFVSNISWHRTYSMRNDSKGIAAEVEHILVYGKTVNWQPNKLERTAEMDAKFKNPDNDPAGKWRNIVASAPNASTHQGMVYAIQNPITGEFAYPPQGRCWSLGQDQMLEAMNKWCEYELRDIHDDQKRAEICGVSEENIKKGVLSIVLKDSREEASKKAKAIYASVLPEFYFSQNGKGVLSRKAYLSKVAGRPVTNFWDFEEVGHTGEASRLLKKIFGGNVVFDTPKPERLLERVISIATDRDSIILDSFAGSGTTAHAVISKNMQDGGNRKYILIEMLPYAESVTAERVRRVIDGYDSGKNKVDGMPGGFSYYELGERIFLEEKMINPNIDEKTIREYIWYMETKTAFVEPESKDCNYFLGINNNTAYYFFYNKDGHTVLDNDFIGGIRIKADMYVIYADTCVISQDKMNRFNISFKKIPRDIACL